MRQAGFAHLALFTVVIALKSCGVSRLKKREASRNVSHEEQTASVDDFSVEQGAMRPTRGSNDVKYALILYGDESLEHFRPSKFAASTKHSARRTKDAKRRPPPRRPWSPTTRSDRQKKTTTIRLVGDEVAHSLGSSGAAGEPPRALYLLESGDPHRRDRRLAPGHPAPTRP